MRKYLWLTGIVALVLTQAAVAEFTLEDDGARLTIVEDGNKVLTYNYGRIDPPKGCEADPNRYWRMNYIHPLYNLDGEILTQDYPKDHYHHRGLFWTWPSNKVGDRDMDLWTIVGARHLHKAFKTREAGEEQAEIAVENEWKFDDDPEAKVREEVQFVVLPADKTGRAIDFHLVFTNICKEDVLIRGQPNANKGYGGFLLRPDAAGPEGDERRRKFKFTTAQGNHRKDVLDVDSAWADISWAVKPGGDTSGAAFFQHPTNPDYPHSGWILRHYGFLGASWPHTKGHNLKPGESVELRYRLYVHRGSAKDANVAGEFQAYEDKAK